VRCRHRRVSILAGGRWLGHRKSNGRFQHAGRIPLVERPERQWDVHAGITPLAQDMSRRVFADRSAISVIVVDRSVTMAMPGRLEGNMSMGAETQDHPLRRVDRHEEADQCNRQKAPLSMLSAFSSHGPHSVLNVPTSRTSTTYRTNATHYSMGTPGVRSTLIPPQFPLRTLMRAFRICTWLPPRLSSWKPIWPFRGRSFTGGASELSCRLTSWVCWLRSRS
jgi:hypothetical protein